MINEVAKNIYVIQVPLPNNPLKYLNSYFIRGDENDLLIDTGFRLPECAEALSAGLKELGYKPDRLDIAITHNHSDHVGMADLFVGKKRHIYMNAEELKNERKFLTGKTRVLSRECFLYAGMSGSLIDKISPKNPAETLAPPFLNEHFCGITEHDEIKVGDYSLKMINVPGHTPHNTMFWIEKEKIMFTGDHVLFDISPNITAWPEFKIRDSLGDYMKSLKYALSFPVKLALPGHRMTGNYHARIRELLEHHKRRLINSYTIIKTNPGLNANEIAGRMHWKIRAKSWDEFPMVQKWFAVGECIAHLDHLFVTGFIKREDHYGIWRYYAN